VLIARRNLTRMAQKDDISENQEGDDAGDDVFGLPEIEYKPLESQESPPPSPVYQEQSWSPPEKQPDRTWVWILLFLLLLAAALFLGYIYIYQPEQKKHSGSKQIQEEESLDSARVVEAPDVKAAIPTPSPVDPPAPAPSHARAAPTGSGSIETLTSKTGQYYIVVSSSVDADLSMDYAKRLKRKGMDVKLIEFHDKVKFTRLAIAGFATLSEAQGALDGVRQEFAQAWVLHY